LPPSILTIVSGACHFGGAPQLGHSSAGKLKYGRAGASVDISSNDGW
jgi:hypothetical protein